MYSYTFRILESGEAYVAAINALMHSCDCTFTIIPEMDGFIYDVEFKSEESMDGFKAELIKILPSR